MQLGFSDAGVALGSCPLPGSGAPGRAAEEAPGWQGCSTATSVPTAGTEQIQAANRGGTDSGAYRWGSSATTFLALVCGGKWSQKSLCAPVLPLPLSLPQHCCNFSVIKFRTSHLKRQYIIRAGPVWGAVKVSLIDSLPCRVSLLLAGVSGWRVPRGSSVPRLRDGLLVCPNLLPFVCGALGCRRGVETVGLSVLQPSRGVEKGLCSPLLTQDLSFAASAPCGVCHVLAGGVTLLGAAHGRVTVRGSIAKPWHVPVSLALDGTGDALAGSPPRLRCPVPVRG